MEEHTKSRKRETAHPVDEGWAWLVFFASMVAVFFAGGIFRTFGVLFVEFRELYGADATKIAMIQSVNSAAFGISITLTLTFGLKYLSTRQCVLIGGILCVLSFILTSRAENLYFLVLSYGVIYGIGFALIIGGSLVILGRYFKKHRGLVNGCFQAAVSLGSLALAPSIRFLIDEYSFRGGILILSGIVSHVIFAACLMRPPELYKEWRKLKEKAAKKKAAAERATLLENDNGEPFRPRSGTSDSTFSPLARRAMLQRMRSRTDEIEDTMPKKEPDSVNTKTDANESTAKESHSKEMKDKDESLVKKEYLYGSNEFIVAISTEDLDKVLQKKRRKIRDSRTSEMSDISNASSKPSSQERGKHCLKSVFSVTVLKNTHFVLFAAAHFFGCVGSFLPIIYIPDIANDNNIDKKYSAMLVSLAGACDVIGRSSMGILSDRKYVDRKILIFISMLITGVADHFIRYFNQLWSLIIFSVIYGLFGGTIVALYSPIVLDTLPLKHLRSGLSILQIGQCISWAISNQVAGVLRDVTGSYSATFHMIGTMCFICCVFLVISKCLDSRRTKREHNIVMDEVNA